MLFSRIQKCAFLTGLLLVSTIFFACQKTTPGAQGQDAVLSSDTQTDAPVVEQIDSDSVTLAIGFEPAETGEVVWSTLPPTPISTDTPIPTDTPVPTPFVTPYAVAASDPKNWNYTSELEVAGQKAASFLREQPISFCRGDDYAAIPGVLTLRGSNYRTNAAYGTVPELTGTIRELWSIGTGSLPKSSSGTWSGSGWTGQCLLVQWPTETRRIMNLYENAKAKDGLIEVIYATMDGNVYFIDAETGSPTRDTLKIGIPFKGAGALDPRGWPILYLGTGDSYSNDKGKGRSMAYSLIDFTRLFEVGKDRDPFSLRNWHAYDSSVLVDAATDTALIPGENGIFYTVKMNTAYNEAAGTLSMAPEAPVKQRYDAKRLGPDREKKYFYGYEASAVAWNNYTFLCDNGGFLRCIDLNTMETVWVQDILDDTNSTPAFEDTYEGAFLYVGNTVDKTARRGKGTSSFFKINAVTGEIVWKYDYDVTTTDHITGGCMSSAVLGEKGLDGLLFTSFSSTSGKFAADVVALDKRTGAVVWKVALDSYTWSSPIALYTESGTGYLFITDRSGKAYLFDGKNGSLLTTQRISENIEASPCAFGDLIVIGTRDKKIIGLRVS